MSRRANLLTRRGFLSIALALGIATAGGAALTGCTQSSTAEGNTSSSAAVQAQEQPSTVIDAKGREVVVPDQIDRLGITCMGGALQTMSVLGGADRVVVAPSPAKSSPLLLEIFPQYKDVPDAGTFDDVNVETIAAADPDIVFVASTSDEGNAKIEEAGFATYTLSTANASVDSLRQEYQNVGILLGTEDIAGNLISFWDETLGSVDEGLKGLKEDEKLTVYRCGAEITKANHWPWAGNWIRTAGGIPVVDDGTTGDVDLETIALWDPDVIITAADPQEVLNDPALQNITAVKNGAVYKAPKGCMGWDIPSPEVPLGFAWLAQVMYPDRFENFNLEQQTKDFYKEFYHYDLTDDGYEAFFK